MVHKNYIEPTHGYAHCTLTLCKHHHHHFSIAENEKKIVNLHLWMVVGNRFHSLIGHWLVKECCILLLSVTKEHSSRTCIGIRAGH